MVFNAVSTKRIEALYVTRAEISCELEYRSKIGVKKVFDCKLKCRAMLLKNNFDDR